ncbi:MAG: hypothetical protein K0Q47_104 [Sedimentibacter sp.]|jgi:group I intron endonuclease|nr:hypothetical protein [Sedimentibacter sp.]
MSCGIYAIKCVVNGKAYVGSSKNIERRWKEHKVSLNKQDKKKCNKLLLSDWIRYGQDKFTLEILEECLPQFIFKKENNWIGKLNSRREGYNINVAYNNRHKK